MFFWADLIWSSVGCSSDCIRSTMILKCCCIAGNSFRACLLERSKILRTWFLWKGRQYFSNFLVKYGRVDHLQEMLLPCFVLNTLRTLWATVLSVTLLSSECRFLPWNHHVKYTWFAAHGSVLHIIPSTVIEPARHIALALYMQGLSSGFFFLPWDHLR